MSQDLEAFFGPDSIYKKYPTVITTFLKLLRDDSFSDLTIKVGSDTVYAHAGIVACRCEDILPLAQDEKSKKRKKHEVRLKDGSVKSGQIMQRVLEYIYTGAVEFPKLTNEEILYVNQAGRSLNLVRLVFLCEKWVHTHLDMDNVFHLLKASSDFKEERMKAICLQYALKNYTDFITNKNGLHILGIDLFQEVVASFNPQNAVKDDSEFSGYGPADTLLDDLRRIHDAMSYYDFSVTIDGEVIKMHKGLLYAHSELFSSIFGSGVMEGLSIKAAKSLLRYLYYAEEKIDSVSACELVEFSRKYKLTPLMKLTEDIISSNFTVPSVMKILQIAYLPVEGKQDLNADLKAKCFPFILDNFASVTLDSIASYHPQIAIDLLSYLQDASKAGRFTVEGGGGGGGNDSARSHHHHHHHHHNNNNNNNNNNNDDNSNHKKKSLNNSSAKKVPPPPPRRADSALPSINLTNSGQNSDSSISEEEITPKSGKSSSHSTVSRKKSTKEDKEKKKEKKEKKSKDDDKKKKREK